MNVVKDVGYDSMNIYHAMLAIQLGKRNSQAFASNRIKPSDNSFSPLKDNGDITSSDNLSIWLGSGEKPRTYEKLDSDIETNVLVVGGGFSGLTTAYCCAKEGLKVVLVEDGFIGSGESGRTTAQLTSA